MKTALAAAFIWITFAYPPISLGDPTGECDGSPVDAVLSLPAAMDDWAQIICTPYGHIIAPEEGWFWSYPGGFSPVMVPSQLVRTQPEEVGNASYFRRVEFVLAKSEKVELVRSAFNAGFDANENPGDIYRLTVENQDGKPLILYFDVDESGKNTWGMWCADECDSDSRFMVLDMREE